MPLMLAVTRCRTLVHYGHKHLCKKHLCKVDKQHIDTSDLLQLESEIKVTPFIDDLINMKLFLLQKIDCYSTISTTLPLKTGLSLWRSYRMIVRQNSSQSITLLKSNLLPEPDEH